MGKFAIQCDRCGNYVYARNGIRGLFQPKVQCTCGNEIDVRANRMTAAVCPTCGNTVVYDQGAKNQPTCPYCKNKIIPETFDENNKGMAAQNAVRHFHCPQCGVELQAAVGTENYSCPICDVLIDVPREIERQRIKDQNALSVIKYEGDNRTFVWKHPAEDFKLGSQLEVHESQEAVFFRDGQALDRFTAGRYTLETQSLPILDKAFKLPMVGDTPFHSEVYFVNMATQMGIKWGTDSKVRLFDPISGLHVELGASGSFNLKVTDSRKAILKLVGTENSLSRNQLLSANTKSEASDGQTYEEVSTSGYFRALIITQVKAYLASVIKEQYISVLEIDEKLMVLSDALRDKINASLFEYGFEMPEFYVIRIITPDDDPNYQKLRQQYADRYLKVREEQIDKEVAEAAAQRKLTEASGEAQVKLVKAQAEAAAKRLENETEALRMQALGYTYQDETARKVSMEAMKNGLGNNDGGISNLASLGIGLGTMGTVFGMTKEAFDTSKATGPNLVAEAISDFAGTAKSVAGQSSGKTPSPAAAAELPSADGEKWECPACHALGLTTAFCPHCGTKRPVSEAEWTCPNCHASGLTSAFCPHCGSKRGI